MAQGHSTDEYLETIYFLAFPIGEYTPQTSGRGLPYVAVPAATPSTCTWTELIGVGWPGMLAKAHPVTLIVPLTAAPEVGESIKTIGGGPTVTVTVAAPISEGEFSS